MDTESPQPHISSLGQSQSTSDNITLEELPEDYMPIANEAETIQPTSYSSPTSSLDSDIQTSESDDDTMSDTGTGVTQRFQDLQCDEDSPKQRRSQDKKKRNAALFKRTYSQSVEDEKDVHLTPVDNFRRKAVPRRMRRRIGRPMSGEWVEEVSDGGSYNDIKSREGSVGITADSDEDVRSQVVGGNLEGNAMEVD